VTEGDAAVHAGYSFVFPIWFLTVDGALAGDV
jgi:hypothetical protein